MAAKITPITLVSPDGREYKVDTKLELNNLVSQGYSRKNGGSTKAAAAPAASKPEAKATAPAKTEKTDPEGSQAPELSAAKPSAK
nr:hypothetical protein [Rhodococcus sp. (in: high G+C Gram-positive bacteria)]